MAITSDSDAITIQDAIGPVDGVNTSFQTPSAFQAGSLAADINGITQLVIETGANTFEVIPAPLSGNKIRVMYAKA